MRLTINIGSQDGVSTNEILSQDIGALRSVGYKQEFLDVSSGVKKYLDVLSRWPKNEY